MRVQRVADLDRELAGLNDRFERRDERRDYLRARLHLELIGSALPARPA